MKDRQPMTQEPPMFSRDHAAILLLSGTLVLMNQSCSRINALWRPDEPLQPVAVSVTPSPAVNPSPQPKPTATPITQPTLAPQDAYEQALDAAYSAATISQSAESPNDWLLVATRWQEAIALLRRVPSSSTYHVRAQSKIAEYERNLGIAKQQATRPRPNSPTRTTVAVAPPTDVQPVSPSSTQTGNSPAPEPETKTAKPRVFKAPIKRRAGRTPVVDVTFNGKQTFEMIVDTGASGTVITQPMAKSLGIVPEGEVIADTASAKGIRFPVGRVQSISINGAVVRDVPVAIGSPDLEFGLLGQDFYSNYDILIRQDVVEFHPR